MPVEAVRREHIDAIADIASICGFPERSPAAWRWILFGNPDQGDLPSGFVACDAQGRPEAFLGSLIMRLRRGDREKTLVCGHTFISARPGAGCGRELMSALFQQFHPIPVATLNNNARSAPVLQRVGYRPWADRRAQGTITWPLRRRLHQAGRALSYLGRRETIYRLLACREWFSNPVQWRADAAPRLLIDPRQTDDLIALHGALKALRASCDGRHWSVSRSLEGYLWRLADPDAPGRTGIFLHPQGHLAMVTLTKLNRHEPALAQITDLAFLPQPDWKHGALELMQAIHGAARQAGAAALRLSPVLDFPMDLASAIGPHHVSLAQHDSCHLYCFPEGLQADLVCPSLAAGDQFFALRTIPGKSRVAAPVATRPSVRRDRSSSAGSLPSGHVQTTAARGW